MAERTFNKQGCPEWFDKTEEHAARKAYNEACAKGDPAKIAEVLAAYPPLTGRNWKDFQPAPSAT